MKRFPKILIATCAAVALSASLALAADAVAPKTTADAQQVSCTGATAAGYTGKMDPDMMGQGMMNGFGQTQLRGTGATAMMGRTL
jgi:opacity protein-like surface antigen